jgi:malonate transporter MadL subunit
MGIDSDIGGVGIAMLLLLASCHYLVRRGLMTPPTESGIVFWSAMYIPIVVAMAASQNVLGAVSSGLVAITAGALTVVASFGLVGCLTRLTAAPSRVKDSL